MIYLRKYLNRHEISIWDYTVGKRSFDDTHMTVGEVRGLLIALCVERHARRALAPTPSPAGRVMEHVRR